MWIDLSEWTKKDEDICIPHECSPDSTSAEDFNNQVERMTHSVGPSQPLSQPMLPDGLVNKMSELCDSVVVR